MSRPQLRRWALTLGLITAQGCVADVADPPPPPDATLSPAIEAASRIVAAAAAVGATGGSARALETPPPAVVMLALGRHNTFAQLSDGRVMAWGQNQRGELAQGTLPRPYPGADMALDAALPVAVPLSDATAITAGWTEARWGGSTACAQRQTGAVTCWGDGALIPNPLAARGQPTPLDIPALEGMSAPVWGWGFGCAKHRGSVWCWGGNLNGELGRADQTPSRKPRRVAIESIEALAAGRGHACAVSTGGALHCWGDQRRGAVSPGLDEHRTEAPIAVDAGHVVSVAATADQTCALRRSGALWCWGLNRIEARPTARGVVSVAAGAKHLCLVNASGEVWCWGANDAGQLGQGPPGEGQASPQRVEGLSEVRSVAAGVSHSCALTREGEVWCWGSNRHGELGDGTLIDRPSPVKVRGLLTPLSPSAALGSAQDLGTPRSSRRPSRCEATSIEVTSPLLHQGAFEVIDAVAEVAPDETVTLRLSNHAQRDDAGRPISPRGDQLTLTVGLLRVDDPRALLPRFKRIWRGRYTLDPLQQQQLIPWATGFENAHDTFSLMEGPAPQGELTLDLVNPTWLCGSLSLAGPMGSAQGVFSVRLQRVGAASPLTRPDY